MACAGPTYVRSPPPGLLDKIVDSVHAATAISEVRQHFGSRKCFFLEVVQKCPDLLLVHLFQRLADLRAVHLDFRRHRLKNAFQPLYLFHRYVLGVAGALAELEEFCCAAILLPRFLQTAPGVQTIARIVGYLAYSPAFSIRAPPRGPRSSWAS